MVDTSMAHETQQMLAAKLRELRRAARMTGGQLSTAANMSPSKLSKIECCRAIPSITDVVLLAEKVGASSEETAKLLAWTESLKDGSIEAPNAFTAIVTQRKIMKLEEAAQFYRYCDLHISGLLQTPDYTRAVLLSIVHQVPIEHFDEIVVDRMRRQAVLVDRNRTFRFLFPESALMSPLAAADVMVWQVRRLIELSHYPNVDLRITRLGEPAPICVQAFYAILDQTCVIQETAYVAVDIRDDENVQLFTDHFDRAWKLMPSEDTTAELLESYLARYEAIVAGNRT